MNRVEKSFDVKLDSLDRRILNVLQSESRIGSQELAERVHSSAPTCLRRVRRLRGSGIISREAVLVDPSRVGRSLFALIHVVLEQQTERLQRAFEQRMQTEPAVSQCYMVSGEVDFVLVVNVADMHEYHAFVRSVLSGHDNIRNFRTLFAMNRSKFETRIDFDDSL
jgi:Lrp/AsnC family leucine-responsive transcriptional regulator